MGLSQSNVSVFLDSLVNSNAIDWIGVVLFVVWLMLSFWLLFAVALFTRPFNYAIAAIFSFGLLVACCIFCLPFDIVRQFIWLNQQTQTAWLILLGVHCFLIIDGFYLAVREPETEME
jgi:hypothetical protein